MPNALRASLRDLSVKADGESGQRSHCVKTLCDPLVGGAPSQFNIRNRITSVFHSARYFKFETFKDSQLKLSQKGETALALAATRHLTPATAHFAVNFGRREELPPAIRFL